MDVGVDEAGDDQRIAVLGHPDPGRQARQQLGGGADPDDPAVLDQQQAVLEILVRTLDADLAGIGETVEQGGAVGLHRAVPHLLAVDVPYPRQGGRRLEDRMASSTPHTVQPGPRREAGSSLATLSPPWASSPKRAL